MQVTEVAAEGLKREYKITVAASEIEDKVQARLKRLAKTAKVPGFRPGKAPVALLRKQYGRSVMGEVLEQAVDEGSRKAIDENALKPALRPKVEVTSFDEGKDLEFKVDLEVLPTIPEVDIKAIELTRQKAEVDDSQVQKSLENLSRARRTFAKLEEARPTQLGDQAVIDFVGTIDGVAFDGGTGEGYPLELGSGRMIPGFEDQLVGKNAGDTVTVEVTFPEDYGNDEIKGKAASFAVTIKEIRAAAPVTIDDELAKTYGAEGLDDLKAKIKERIEADFKAAGRNKTKRQLLDRLADGFPFGVPAGMVELEHDAIWKQLTEEMERTGAKFGEGKESEEEASAEYRRIAERRVRLGLILSDIGTKNEITVESPELQQAMIAQARRYPGQEKEVFEFFRNNQSALEQLRAPIFEDKVVDFMIELAKVTEETVSVEELMREPDDENGETPANAVSSPDDKSGSDEKSGA